ncbi:hypothetical protein N657DRAFT_656663 [Parathielavia appendiculata]|uniref:Uncharacterized protein n=1 Tax=Parathielavia appendiculata TaxID=2587402 RepID=A0AAN6TZ77_9PEZI|nr:hypothetical protein N657DRAFT_656663 [Parathielavia appendiculata]
MGLNMATALKEIATHMRWWFLDKGAAHIREPDVVIWPIVDIAEAETPIAISVLSLTYKADPGVQDIYLDAQQNMVAIPDMSRFVMQGRFQDGSQLQSYAAHILGDIGSSYNYSMLPEEPLTEQPVAKYPSSFWNATNHWEYVFVNSAPGQISRDFNFLSVFSNQSILSSATCLTPPYDFHLNSTTQTIVIQQRDPGTNRTITFPTFGVLEEQLVYLTKPFSSEEIRNQSDTTGHCGPGCSTVDVLESQAGPPAQDSFVNPDSLFFYYECNITVAPKGDVPRAGQFNLSATNAALAAQAIALSGRTILEPEGTVYTSYNLGLPFGQVQNNSAAGMAAMVSRFAIGVVAAAAQTNPKILVPGRPPRQGVSLVLDQPAAFAAILIATLGVHLVLFVLAVLMVRGVEHGVSIEATAYRLMLYNCETGGTGCASAELRKRLRGVGPTPRELPAKIFLARGSAWAPGNKRLVGWERAKPQASGSTLSPQV